MADYVVPPEVDQQLNWSNVDERLNYTFSGLYN